MRALATIAAASLALAALVTMMANRPSGEPRPLPSILALREGDMAPPRVVVAAPPTVRREALEAPPTRSYEPEPLFINTYYEFPTDRGETADTPIYGPRCASIASVSRAFHDRVCVQGSGRLASGETVSFAERDCACAEVCPRTGQRICYEKLDPARFPHGRGAMGQPVTPMSTVAVDPMVIPLGTSLFIPEFEGLPRPDGSRHDGCFVAEDRGIKIVGRRIDVFAGEPEARLSWEALVPSNSGVHVLSGSGRCEGREERTGHGARSRARREGESARRR